MSGSLAWIGATLTTLTTLTTLMMLTTTGCGASSKATNLYDTGAAAPEGALGGSDGAGEGGGGDTGGIDDGLGTEDETTERRLRPAATPRAVYIANADRDTVTRVDVATLAVRTAPVGARPGAVRTTPDERRVVVLNLGSDSVSLLDADTLEGPEVGIRPHLNTLELDPTGRWAVAAYSADADEDADPDAPEADGAQSYNEVSFVRIDDGSHHPRVVGFAPRAVQFTPDGAQAVFVSDAWLALVDLTGDEPGLTRVRIASDTVTPPAAEEVLVTPDGRYAFVRQYGVDTLKLVDLSAGTVTDLAVGANPTDLDLTPDGARAIAVCRTASELCLYDTADPTAPAVVVPLPRDEIFGSIAVSADGSQALLYSTATGRARYGTWPVGDTDPDAVVVRSLVKAVHGVSLSVDGGTALVVHDDSSAGASSDSPFRDHWALTVLSLTDHFANPLRLAAEPFAFATTADGRSGAFLMRGEAWLEVIDFETLLTDEVPLRSEARHLGVVPNGRTLWASQVHELGRISFYDIDAGDLSTITGFELNAGIEQ